MIFLECSDIWPECGGLDLVAFGEAAEVKFNKCDDGCAAAVDLVFGPVAISAAVFFDRGVLAGVEGLRVLHCLAQKVFFNTVCPVGSGSGK